MSDATPTQPATDEKGNPTLVEEGGRVFELNAFEKDTPAAGFSFYVMQFKSLEDSITHYKGTEKGEGALLTLINRALNFNMRTKAKNMISNDDTKKKLLAKGDTLLISVDEARLFVPGERDVSSVSGLYKQIEDLKAQAKEAREGGDTTLADSYKDKVKVLYAKLKEKVLEGLDED